MNLFWLIIGVLLGLLLGAGFFFSTKIVYPKVMPLEETRRTEKENGRYGISEEEWLQWEKEEFEVLSPFGYPIVGWYYPVKGSKKTAVISHGITYSLYGSVKYAILFRKRGFNVVMYDHRNHGHSGGKNTTFGLYEKQDLKAVVDWAFSRLGEGGVVGTMGESMGAATVLQHAAIDNRLSFVMADCPYSDLARLLAYRMKVEFHLPSFPMINLASFFCWLQTGMSFSRVSPLRDVQSFCTPLFLAHGQEDDYILPTMSQEMFNASPSPVKRLFLAPNAKHADSLVKNREIYDQKVGEFLTTLGLSNG